MSQLEKTLKKIDQERSKGNFERALERLKGAMSEHPGELLLVRDAVTLAFDLDRARDALVILRQAMKRCRPEDRGDLLAFAKSEFDRERRLELGEFLFESAMAESDFEGARNAAAQLSDADRGRLLTKLSGKVDAARDTLPDEKQMLVGFLLAKAIACSGAGRSDDTMVALDRVLTLDPELHSTVHQLAKHELSRSSRCALAHLLIARCELATSAYEKAAEHVTVVAEFPEIRKRTLELLRDVPADPHLLACVALLQLHERQPTEAHATLQQLLKIAPTAMTLVRLTLERVQQVVDESLDLRLLYAGILGDTGAARKGIVELVRANRDGASPAATLEVANRLLAREPREPQLLELHARLTLQDSGTEPASRAIQQLLEVDRGRAFKLRDDVRRQFEASQDPNLGHVLVELLVELGEPLEAATVLQTLRTQEVLDTGQLFHLVGLIAGKYGFSANLAALYVETALELERVEDAQAAAVHFASTAEHKLDEFMGEMEELVARRGELAATLPMVLQGLPVPIALQMRLVQARLGGDDVEEALRELVAIVASHPEQRDGAIHLLGEANRQHGDRADRLEQIAEFLADGGRGAAAAEYLARALRCDQGATDRICRRAEKLLTDNASRDEVWRPLILALVDTDNLRHAREFCYRAEQSVAKARQGFLHVAMGHINLRSHQLAAATASFESALSCGDAAVERIADGMRQVVARDAQHGHAHYVLGVALTRLEGQAEEALEHLREAVRLDTMLAESVLEQLTQHATLFATHAQSKLLEGRLRLQRGDRVRGVELLDEALALDSSFSEQTIPLLQAEWDREADCATGLALGRALRCTDQLRRACRLLAEVAHTWPEEQQVVLVELEHIATTRSFADVHRTLWEIRLERDERDLAFEQVKRAYEALAPEPAAQREMLDTAHRQMPESTWITCRLAELEIDAGHSERAGTLLREQLELDLSAWQEVLQTLRARGQTDRRLALLEIDTLLAGERWSDALNALRQARVRFDDFREPAVARYRLLATRGDTGLAADLDLGLLLQELGDIDAAVGVLEAAARQTNGATLDAGIHDEIRLALASMYVDLGREGEGKQLVAAVLEGPGDHVAAFRFLEQVARKGVLGKLQQLQTTVSHAPGNLRARLDLARLAISAGEFKVAREALTFSGGSLGVEALRRFLLARSYADDDRPHLAAAVLRSVALDDVSDGDVRRDVMYLQARCNEQLGQTGMAHALYLRVLSEFPGYKDAFERARDTYQRHLETSLETRALVLEKRTPMESS